MFKIILTTIFMVLLTSCAAKPVFYKPIPELNKLVAVKMIEQVLYEQHEKYRPESVFISEEFIALNKGLQSNTRGSAIAVVANRNLIIGLGSSKTLTKEMSQRIYFNSLGEPKLYLKKGRYIAQIKDVSGQTLLNVPAISEAKAKSFINSLMYFVEINRNGVH